MTATADFHIRFLDHVAIRVSDIDQSVRWYQEVLGLKVYRFGEWGEFPVFMLSDKTGVALFPADTDETRYHSNSRQIRIDHFAFNLSRNDFAKARQHLSALKIEYDFQDHHFFHSVYFKDPDGHKVELTTLLIPDDDFYL